MRAAIYLLAASFALTTMACAEGSEGPEGPPGETGPAGVTGQQGEQGIEGPQGLQGEVGPAGLQGEMGPAGPQGDLGPVGPQGDVGPVGPAGPQGDVGPRGADADPNEVAIILASDSDFVSVVGDELVASHADDLRGAEGPQGIQGLPGVDGSPDTAAEILSKLASVDGAGSGLEADTLDGQQASDLTDRIAQLEAQLADLISRMQDRQQQILFAFDGAGVPLGRVVDMTQNSVVFVDPVSGAAIEAVIGPWTEGIHQSQLLRFESHICSGTPVKFRNNSSSTLGVINENTGSIYVSTGNYRDNVDVETALGLQDGDGYCVTSAGGPAQVMDYQYVRTIPGYTAGVYVAAIAW